MHVTVVSNLQHRAVQQQAFDDLRERLASGTAPIGPTDSSGEVLATGTPIALIEIRAIQLSEVVLEGTEAATLFDGPGHRRDTPLPGQVGTSVLYGRRTMYGGPFSALGQLRPGDAVTVTTGQGAFEFTVTGIRREGDFAPVLAPAGAARLLLVTTAGGRFVPDGLLRVDAELTTAAVGGAPRLVGVASLAAGERAMEGDSSTLWLLALWLQALIALVVAAIWAWTRWGKSQAWIVFLPPIAFVSLGASGELVRLLPNLM